MDIGIIGGGSVGQTLGAALIKLGHHVTIGIRAVSSEELSKARAQAKPLSDWVAETGGRVATMAEAAEAAELIISATHGDAAIAALTLARAENLAGKVVVDVSNPLDFSKGFPPALSAQYSGHTSLGEQVQAAFPQARIVKGFNTIAAAVMVNPGLVRGDHDLFLAGNDAAAKEAVSDLARSFGWQHIVDLGDITGARATEALLPIWLRLMSVTGNIAHNLHVARG